jgi:hypothetical protein
MRGWSVALAVLVGGCVYNPDSFHFGVSAFPGKRVKLPCLDVTATLTDDDKATSPVVLYSFGNRCTHAAIVDLGAVRAIGRYPDGTGRELHAYDPRHELRPLPIDAWWRSDEEIMYVADAGTIAPNVVCVDLGSAERVTAPAPHWVCLGASDDGGVP